MQNRPQRSALMQLLIALTFHGFFVVIATAAADWIYLGNFSLRVSRPV
jgi:hypothetical protein